VSRARQVAEMAKTAETDRTLPDLCSTVGLRPRTVQRLFLQHAGVSPTWVLRRYRSSTPPNKSGTDNPCPGPR